jgi:hypothetical protein
MKPGLLDVVPFHVVAAIIFLLLILFNWLGYKLRRYLEEKKPEAIDEQQTITNSLLGLMALLLAFSFSLAASKFDNRKKLIIEESNDIGTAVLRAELFPDSTAHLLKSQFKSYIQYRVDYYNAGTDANTIKAALDSSQLAINKIWKLLMQSSKDKEQFLACQLMIPAVNDVMDIVTTRENARTSKVPPLILWMLLLLSLTSAFITGYNGKEKKRNHIMVIGFALMTSLTLYLVMELDHPRKGIINLDAAEQNISSILESLK